MCDKPSCSPHADSGMCDFDLPDTKYTVSFHDGRVEPLDIEGLEDILRLPVDDEIESIEPNGVEVGCCDCFWSDSVTIEKAREWLSTGCLQCLSSIGEMGHVGLRGTREVERARFVSPVGSYRQYFKAERLDYWELIVHFTDGNCFRSILAARRILAKETGYFEKTEGTKAVCLTDVPLLFCDPVRRTYGDYGFVFTKSSVKEAGGNPAIYLTDDLIEAQKAIGFAERIKPFVNVIRTPTTSPVYKRTKRVDHLHDREWRVAGDIDFDKLPPVGIVLPKDDPFGDDDWRSVLRAAYEYGLVEKRHVGEYLGHLASRTGTHDAQQPPL